MTAEEVKAMPISQKLEIMEAIWADLRERFEHLEMTPQIEEFLDQRRARVRDGSGQLLGWDSVKATIGRP